MNKRLFDILVSSVILFLGSPVLFAAALAIWLQDFHFPFYMAPRIGKDFTTFRMIKLRSMVVNADKIGVDSTAADDKRITKIGRLIRRFKLDELTQMLNVFLGDMSLVGPRPNVKREVDIYTDEEKRLLSVRPGITDFASIVFSDEGDILEGADDPDIAYNQFIRPWKSRLGLFYIDHQSFLIDLRLIFLTALAIISRKRALSSIYKILDELGADEQLKRVALRKERLEPYPPPGATEIVTSRTKQ